MPLEKSHVIVICTVSPLVVGLAAYYWCRSRRKVNIPDQDNVIVQEEPEFVPISVSADDSDKQELPIVPVSTDDDDSNEMTRQRRDKTSNGPTDVIDESAVSQPVAVISTKGEIYQLSTDYRPSDNVSLNDSSQTVPCSGIVSEDLYQETPHPVENGVDEELNLLQVTQSDHSNSDPGCQGVRIDSNFSDTHTEVSADSGIGVNSDSIVFKFDFPSDLVGLLIGLHGRNVRMLQEKSGARVHIERSNYSSRYQVCVVEGSSHCVDAALELIRDRFPHLDLGQLTSDPSPTSDIGSAPVPIPQLRIPQHTMSDVCISSIVNAGNLYLQQPTHPYFRELEALTQQMNAVYSDFGAPPLPEQTPVGVICAAPWIDQVAFCRALILSVNESTGLCQVRYVDHGSTVELPLYSLRQIRSDFLRLPFQATECYLSNIVPLDGQETFSVDAAAYLQKVTEGFVLLCWVHGFEADGKPLVELYLRHGTQKVSVNRLLVENGYAKWSESVDSA